MLSASRRPYVCWRCFAQTGQALPSSRALVARRLDFRQTNAITTQADAPPLPERPFGFGNIPTAAPAPQKESRPDDKRRVRERLRDWKPRLDWTIEDINEAPLYGTVSNTNTKMLSSGASELDHFKSTPEGMLEAMIVTGNEDAETIMVGSNTRNPGDLVEMRQPGARSPLFAIYLGYFGSRHHFYADNGRWVVSLGFSALFVVSNFATAAEIQPVLDALPKDATGDDFNQLRKEDKGPSRLVGAPLMQRMSEFVLSSEEYYQNSLNNLDRARALISDSKRTKYLSLFEIADMLLPQSARKGDSFSPPALYAVHTALYRNDFIFRPLSPTSDCHRRDHLFEVFPYHDIIMINRITAMIRDYSHARGKRGRAPTDDELGGNAFGTFILRAREIVKTNREKRTWTPYGILAPSQGVTLEAPEWSRAQMDIIRYLEWWASYDLFDQASRFHAYGSLILRALDLYEGASLDQSTAWSFLQEVGSIPPWEIPSRYRVRFPGVQIQSGGGLTRKEPTTIEDSRRPDIAAGSRREWTGVNVLCIDKPETMLIDDGVSLERTDKEDEFWIHVHTADPASGILPNSELGKFMELIPENIYLPGHFQAMLPSDMGADDTNDYESKSLTETYSLGPGRPTLTFSARVNELGEVLEHKVEPGVLDKVSYLDPRDVIQFCQEPVPPPAPEQSLSVGTRPSKTNDAPGRTMTAANALDSDSKRDLLTLYRLSEALKKRRLSKGAWPYFPPKPSVKVAFETPAAAGEGEQVLPPDPYIEVGYDTPDAASVVSNTMVLAGEIAAHWCADRGIAVPYRKDLHSGTNFARIHEYATKQLYPLLLKGVQPSPAQRQELTRLTGGIEISATPGPYFMLGLDMYAKATSPLRRFSDLILHWQVHAALAHEREVGRKLDASVDELDKVLPFTSETLKNTLSLLHMRERMGRILSYGIKEWILMAVLRDWKFENRPERKLRFTVDATWLQGLTGRINLFDLEASMTTEDIDSLALLKDIKAGDEFDVEITNMNIHQRLILVKALAYRPGGQRAAAAS